MTEPVLQAEDLRAWALWEMACHAHAKTPAFRRALESARRTIQQMMAAHPSAYLTWSAGKDSTALVHLALSCGASGRIMSVKDDLDFPDEVPYLHGLAAAWGVTARLDILTPPSIRAWLADRADAFDPSADIHGRAADLSAAFFYPLTEEYSRRHGHGGVYLGLRAEESAGRKKNRMTRGRIYTKADGQTICTPLVDWSGLDVFAYLLSSGIPVLPVYRCCADVTPSRIRKSWWLPGVHSARGAGVFLRRYYPSLYQEMLAILPHAGRIA